MMIGRKKNARHSQLDLVLGGLDRVGAVADVAADGERKVAADGACGSTIGQSDS